jgi:hypothetical protein
MASHSDSDDEDADLALALSLSQLSADAFDEQVGQLRPKESSPDEDEARLTATREDDETALNSSHLPADAADERVSELDQALST